MGLIAGIYRELLKLNNNPIQKWAKDLNTSPENIQMTNKYIKHT